MVRSRALVVCEPGQIREEAALSSSDQAPRVSLTGASGRRERPGTRFRTGCTVHLHNFYVRLRVVLRSAGNLSLSPRHEGLPPKDPHLLIVSPPEPGGRAGRPVLFLGPASTPTPHVWRRRTCTERRPRSP